MVSNKRPFSRRSRVKTYSVGSSVSRVYFSQLYTSKKTDENQRMFLLNVRVLDSFLASCMQLCGRVFHRHSLIREHASVHTVPMYLVQ